MADANTQVDIDAMQDAIEAQIAAAFPVFQTVEFEREDRKTPVNLPACMLELDEFETDDADPDPGDGLLAGYARFAARLIIPFRSSKIASVMPSAGGSGYTSAPTVSFSGGGAGSGAAATAVLGTNAKRTARRLSADLAAFLRLRRWTGIHSGPGEVVGFYKDDFDPELDQFEVWRVEWAHIVHLGVLPDSEGVIPTTVYARAANPQGAELDDPLGEQLAP